MARAARRRANPPPPQPKRTTVTAPEGMALRWLVAGTPILEPYPCRCHERKYSRCSPRYCPCAGRANHPDTLPDGCCARAAQRTPEPQEPPR